MTTYTLTFGDAGENHAGMEMIGTIGEPGSGFTLKDLKNIESKLSETNVTTQLFNLKDLLNNNSYVDLNIDVDRVADASVLVIRNGVSLFLNDDEEINLSNEMDSFTWDSKYYDTRRKKVLNKNARHNVCFGSHHQDPDYENKKGTIISYNEVPILNKIRIGLVEKFGSKAENLICEGNKYYDVDKCGIGWHGDSERTRVIALRIGSNMCLKYRWYHKSKPISSSHMITLYSGDMYIMSEKAVGQDWKKSSKITLRHCAGSRKFVADK